MDLTRREIDQGAGRRGSCGGGRHRPAGRRRGQRRDARRRGPAQMVQGALPLLRHRLRRDGRGQGRPVVATHGDIHAEVNRGLNCVKGYFLSKIMYGADRLTTPLLRMTRRRVRQGRRVHAGHLGPGVRRHGREVQGRAQGQGAVRRRHVRLGPVDDLGGLRRQQAVQGRLPLQQHRPQRPPLHGLGGVRLHAHLRHGRADGLLRRHRGRRRLRALGLEHGRDAPDPVDAGDRPPPVAPARARWPCSRPSSTAASISPTSRSCSRRRPIWRSSTTSPATSSRPAASTRTSSASTRCSAAATPTSATGCGRSTRWSRRPPTPRTPAARPR